jgi:hypothetical protein
MHIVCCLGIYLISCKDAVANYRGTNSGLILLANAMSS